MCQIQPFQVTKVMSQALEQFVATIQGTCPQFLAFPMYSMAQYNVQESTGKHNLHPKAAPHAIYA